jgi:hypothetical protein
MAVLTPASRAEEASSAAAWEGTVNSILTLISSTAAVFLAMRNPSFVKRTNMQSRTALAIMPAFFVFTLTSELKLSHKMHEIAEESQHNEESVKWAIKQQQNRANLSMAEIDAEEHLLKLYRQSVEESGVSIVPGNALSVHHHVANYTAANPIKVLAAMAVPSIGWIFYGQTGQEHLKFSVKLLHTRVFGQFATISLLLTVMGFKEYMTRHGNFITEGDADKRVEDMKDVRDSLMARLEVEKEQRDAIEQEIKKAHDQDVKEDNVHVKHGKKKKMHPVEHAIDHAIQTGTDTIKEE